jgi:tRNA threonylcarbamoyladenosine biosynthesis protein TsaB
VKILAVDTATASCGVSIIEEGNILADLNRQSGNTHAVRLMEMIEEAFNLAGCELKDISAIGVTRGPGSFTGLRIGISTVKGLALASEKPVVGVSTLNALAFQAVGKSGEILSLIDARREEVYYAKFHCEGAHIERMTQDAVGPIHEALNGIECPAFLIGNACLPNKDIIRQRFGDLFCEERLLDRFPRGSDVAFLALDGFKQGKGIHPEGLLPLYLRKSDAEKSRS